MHPTWAGDLSHPSLGVFYPLVQNPIYEFLEKIYNCQKLEVAKMSSIAESNSETSIQWDIIWQ